MNLLPAEAKCLRQERRSLLYSFIGMTVAFGANHGTVTAALTLASSQLGDRLGGWQTGVLYTTYTLSALFSAAGMVETIGPRRVLALGMFLYCAYTGSFLVAIMFPSAAEPVALTGAAVGGIAAGWLWTAQGVYFGRVAAQLERLKRDEVVELGCGSVASHCKPSTVAGLLATEDKAAVASAAVTTASAVSAVRVSGSNIQVSANSRLSSGSGNAAVNYENAIEEVELPVSFRTQSDHLYSVETETTQLLPTKIPATQGGGGGWSRRRRNSSNYSTLAAPRCSAVPTGSTCDGDGHSGGGSGEEGSGDRGGKTAEWLAGLFATIFIFLEVLCKGMSSVLRLWGGPDLVYAVFTILAVVSAVGVFFIKEVGPDDDGNKQLLSSVKSSEADSLSKLGVVSTVRTSTSAAESTTTVTENVTTGNMPVSPGIAATTPTHDMAREEEEEESLMPIAKTSPATAEQHRRRRFGPPHHQQRWYNRVLMAVRLLVSRSEARLLIPLNAAFGLTSIYLNNFLNADVAKPIVGEANVGYLAAVTPLTAAILAMPLTWLSSRTGKRTILTLGAFAYMVPAVVVASLGAKRLKALGWPLLTALYAVEGTGRSVFENTNKATYAIFFPNQLEAAFANVVLASGGTAAVASFVFPYIPLAYKGGITAATSLLAAACIMIAFRVYRSRTTSSRAE